MRHAILGAGGVGGLCAAALANAGEDVTVILRPEALKSYPPQISLESSFGSFSVPVQRTTAVTQPYDVLWIAVKAIHLDSALKSVPAWEELGAIVPLLNGIDHVEVLRQRFSHERVVPATISVESERVSAGHIVHRSPFARLNVSSIGEKRLAPAVDKLAKFGFECKFVADEATLLWSKLVFLAPFALATTAASMNIGEIISDSQWRMDLEKCVREACAVGIANEARVDAAQVMKMFESVPSEMRSSMQKDVAAGNPPELDAIAGPIIRGGQQLKIPVPITERLVEIISSRKR